MPAMLTHDFFGQDAFGTVLDSVGLFTPDERDAFLLGNQGPDPLFYLLMLPPLDEFRQVGIAMHAEAPDATLVGFRNSIDELDEPDQAVARAYLAGFVCHYLLDRATHPFVYFWARGLCEVGVEGLDTTDSGAVHAEVERDLDEMVLYAKRNQTIEVYKPYEQVLRGREQMLDVIGQMYYPAVFRPRLGEEPTFARVYPVSVSCFRVVQRLLWSKGRGKGEVFARIEAPMFKHRYSSLRAMSHRVRAEATSDFDNRERKPWRNPFTGEVRNDSFWDIYNDALTQVADAVALVLGDGFDEDAAAQFTQGLNFSGERV